MKTIILKRMLIYIAVWLTLAALPLVLAAPDAVHHAGLVIDYGEGNVDTLCVDFTEDTLTGYQLLDLSGIKFEAAWDAQSAAICHIGGESGVGCPTSNCFCEAPQAYWSYWQQADGEWVYSNTGASSAKVVDGAVNGWLWGDASQPPPAKSLDEICDFAPTPTATWTLSPSPSPTVTPMPTATPTSTPPAQPADLHETEPTAMPESYVKFGADAEVLAAGTCTQVHWETVGADEVWLDGNMVESEGSEEFCSCEMDVPILEVIFADGKREKLELKVDVEGRCDDDSEPPVAATATPTVTPMLTATPMPMMGTTTTAAPTPTELPTLTATPTVAPREDHAATPTPAEFLSVLPTPPLLPSRTPLPSATASPTPLPVATLQPAATSMPTASLTATTTLSAALAFTTMLTANPAVTGELAIGAAAYLPTPTRAEAPPALNSTLPSGSGVGSYFVFGLLLVGLGGAHLLIQRQSMCR